MENVFTIPAKKEERYVWVVKWAVMSGRGIVKLKTSRGPRIRQNTQVGMKLNGQNVRR